MNYISFYRPPHLQIFPLNHCTILYGISINLKTFKKLLFLIIHKLFKFLSSSIPTAHFILLLFFDSISDTTERYRVTVSSILSHSQLPRKLLVSKQCNLRVSAQILSKRCHLQIEWLCDCCSLICF